MPRSLAKLFCFVFIACALTLLVGCSGEELVSARDERESNRYIALLAQHGIPAERAIVGRNGKDVSIINVRAEDRIRAIELLSEYGLPEARDSAPQSEAVSSFLPPTPEENARRELNSKAAETTRLLELLPGVLSAGLSATQDNLQRRASPNELDSEQNRESGLRLSLILRLLPNARVAEVEADAKEIVSQIFISPYHLTVSIPKPRRPTEAGPQEELVELFFPFPFHVPVSEVRNVQLQIYSLFGFGVVLSLIVGWFLGADVMRRRLLSGRVPKGTFERLQEIARQAELQSRKMKDRQRAGTGIPMPNNENSSEAGEA